MHTHISSSYTHAVFFLSSVTVSLGDMCVRGYSSELSLSRFPHAHYRSRFKEMGTHLHRQPRGWSPRVKQPGDSYQLLQSYFAED